LLSERRVASLVGPLVDRLVKKHHPYSSLQPVGVASVATIRERRPGIWEVRVFTGRGEDGRPTQVSRTVWGGKRAALRVAASLESRPQAQPGGRTSVSVIRGVQQRVRAFAPASVS
jgi:hypothetical protein